MDKETGMLDPGMYIRMYIIVVFAYIHTYNIN